MFREQDKAWGFHSNKDRLASDIVRKVGVWLPTFSTNTLPYPCAIKHRTWRPRSEQSCFVAGRSRIQIRLRHLRSPASLRAVLQSLRAEAWPVPSLRPRWFFYYSSLTSSYYPMLYSTVIQFIYSACHSWGVKRENRQGASNDSRSNCWCCVREIHCLEIPRWWRLNMGWNFHVCVSAPQKPKFIR